MALFFAACASALAGELRDPMRPAGAAPVDGAVRGGRVPTQVQALFIAPTRRAAVVDGRLVHEGERAGLCEVLEILDDGVRCRFPRSVRVVRLEQAPSSIKTPAAAVAAASRIPPT
ncbi:MAG: hypothetical protein U1F11_10955 [Steroidobacteraceae bacterium]